MKVYCKALLKKPHTGKGFFAHRLAKAMRNLGITFIDNPKVSHDIDLAISFKHLRTGGKKYILRLDGLYYDTKKDPRNKPIARSFKRADGIVYQSNFSRKLVKVYMGYLGVKASGTHTVIHNGADVKWYDNIKAATKPHKYQALAANRWRPHKRLKETIAAVLRLDLDVGLWIAGNVSGPSHARVSYLGKLNQSRLGAYYKAADVTIHLCPYDNCPNTVVESIAAGTPVLCTCSGGTPELVGTENGAVCKAEKPFNYKPVNQHKPKAMNIGDVSSTLRCMLLNPTTTHKGSVDIKNTALSYIQFFKRHLG